MTRPSSAETGPLAGLRVVDLTQVLSGPYCTMLLADLGADVIKVEPPHGDPTRRWGPYLSDDELRAYGGYFQSVNRNKRSLVLDLKQTSGRQVLMDLLDGADVLVENFRAGVMDRFGLSYERLHGRFGRLVYAAIRGFGDPRTGASPYRDWPAYDIVAQAMGGLVGITGPDERQPTKAGPGVGDIFPAVLAAVGILAAVRHADGTGEGQFVDVALYDGVLSLCERIAYQHSYTVGDPAPQGNTHPLLCPYGVVRTADGWVTIAAPTDHHWRLLSNVIGRPELGGDERFATNAARVRHSREVYVVLEEWTGARRTTEVVATVAGVVPCGPVNRASDIASDPHVAARGMLPAVDHPGSRTRPSIAGCPIKFAGTPSAVRTRAPLLGEHTGEILAGLGYPAERVTELQERGAVA
jgi:crotonobetainyl-CoA:carnitine CoA-transferase CaiB-like acyl-CoA transferase